MRKRRMTATRSARAKADPMDDLILQYSTSSAFSSGIVRRLTHSAFSHVDIVITPRLGRRLGCKPGLLGASGKGKYKVDGRIVNDPGGVIIRPFEAWPYMLKKTVRVRTPKAEAVVVRALTQLDKPFDNEALWAFLGTQPGTRDWRDSSAWFCSELVTWAEEVEHVFDWPLLIAKNRVSPNDSLIINNPLIDPSDVVELRQLLVAKALAPAVRHAA